MCALVGLHKQRQEGADAEIDAAPADVEGALPLLARVGEQAAATADAGVVEQQMDLVGRLLLDQLIAKTLVVILDRDVGNVGGDSQALRQLLDLAEPLGLGHRLDRDVAHRDIASFSNELPRQLAPHARAATGDDGNLSGEILHVRSVPSLILPACLFLVSAGARIAAPAARLRHSTSPNYRAATAPALHAQVCRQQQIKAAGAVTNSFRAANNPISTSGDNDRADPEQIGRNDADGDRGRHCRCSRCSRGHTAEAARRRLRRRLTLIRSDRRRSGVAQSIVIACALSDVGMMSLDLERLSAPRDARSERGTAPRYSAVSICTGARRRRTLVATLKTSLSRPRHEKSMTTSWCRNPLPPFTSPRSRIKQ
ncbi:hypothetical protein ACVWW1_001785 [Bradyrhizobium sp. JR3.5]